MKTKLATHVKPGRPSICTSTIAAAVIIVSQVAPFFIAPTASAVDYDVIFGNSLTEPAVVGGATGLTKNGDGALLLTNSANTYTGTTTINGGVVSITNAGALGLDTSAIIINGNSTRGAGGGKLAIGGQAGPVTISRDIEVRGLGPSGDGGAISSVGDNIFSGVITTGTGAQTRFLATYGVTQINGGLNLGAGQTFQLGGNANWIVNANIGTTTAALQKLDNGFLQLNGNNQYSGITTLSAGTIRVSEAANLGTNTSNTAITLSGGTLQIRTGTGGSTFADRGVSQSAAATLFVDHAVGAAEQNQTVTFRRFQQSAGNLTLTINGRNGYNTTIGTGTGLAVAVNQAGNAVINNNTNGLVTYDGDFWGLSNGTSRTFSLGGNGSSLITGNILATGTGTANHNITKTGSGTLTILGNASTYDGFTNVNGGTVSIASIGALNNAATGASGRINIGTGGTSATLEFTGSGAAADYLVAKQVNLAGTSGSATINANQTGSNPVVISDLTVTGVGNKNLILGGSNTADNLISGAIVNGGTGTTSLVKNGTGTWAISGANTYSGNTTVNNGTLKLQANVGNTAVSGAGGALIFNTDGGTLELVGAAGTANTETFSTLTATAGAGVLKLTPGTGGTAAMAFGSLGTVNLASGLDIQASGPGNTVTVAGVANGFIRPNITYNGADFAIATGGSGVLAAPVYGTTAGFVTTAVALTNAAHNEITGSFSQGAESINSLKVNGGQALTLTGALTVNDGSGAGGILQTGGAGVIAQGGGGSILTGGTANSAIVLNVNSGSSLDIQVPMVTTGTAGSSPFTKNGAGLLTLSAANTQRGTNVINKGAVILAGNGVSTLGANGSGLTIRDGASLDLSGRSVNLGTLTNSGSITSSGSAAVTIISTGGTSVGSIIESAGAISMTKNGTGGATWNNVSNYTGATTITSTSIVTVTTLANGGVNSSIGAATNDASNLVFSTSGNAAGAVGGLSYTGSESVSTDRLFTIAGNTVNAGARIQANGANGAGLIFSNTGPIVVSGTSGAKILTLGGGSLGDNIFNPQIVDGSGTAVVSVRKEDAGLWILGNSANSYTGSTTINNGTLQAEDGTSLPSGSALLIGSTGTAATTAVFQGSGTLTRTLGTGAGQIAFIASGTNNLVGLSAGDSKFTVNIGGGSTLTWGGANFVADGQPLILSSTTALSEIDLQNPIDLGSGARELRVADNTSAGADIATVSGVVSGAGGLVKTGAGILRLTGTANTYGGDTEIRQGTMRVLSLGNNSGIGSSSVGAWGSGAVVIGNAATGATLAYVGTGETSSRAINLGGTTANTQLGGSGSGALILTNVTNTSTGTGGKTLTLGGDSSGPNEITSNLADNVDGGVLTVTKADTGTWILSGASTYTGNTNNNGGGIIGIGANATGSAGAVTSGPFGTGTFVQGNGSLGAVGADRTILNSVTIANNTTSGYLGAYSIIIDSDVTVANGNNTNTYDNYIVAGTGGKALIINGKFSHNDTNNKTQNFTGSGETIINGQITQTNTGNLNLQMSGVNGTDGTLTINNGSNSYNGFTTVAGGTLIIGAAGALPNTGTASIVNLNGGRLQAASVAAGSVSNVVVLGGNSGVKGTNTIEFSNTVTNNAANRVFTNELTGGAQLVMSGTLYLGEGTTNRVFTLTGAGNSNITGVIAGNPVTGTTGQFIKAGDGTATVSNSGNSYTNGTVISGGVLKLGASDVIPNVGTVTIRQESAGTAFDNPTIAGTLDLNGNSDTIGALTFGSTAAGTAASTPVAGQTPSVIDSVGGGLLTLGGTVTYNAGAAGNQNGQATISANIGLGGANRTFAVNDSTAAPVDLLVSGAISNGGTTARAITKQGLGTMVLSNTGNSYSGGTVVENGTLQLGAANVIPNAGTVTVRAQNLAGVSPGVLDLNGFSDTIGALSMGNTATGSAGGAGLVSSVVNTGAPAVLTLGGTVTYNAGTAGFQNGTATISANLGLGGASRTFNVNDSDQVTTDMLISGVISNGSTTARGLTKAGDGTLVLTNVNTYTGATVVNGGTLVVDGSISASSGISTGTAGGTISGSGTLPAVTIGAGGNLNPGNSPGVINTGDVNLGAGGTLTLEIASLASFDQVNVVGTITLAGNTSVSLFGAYTAAVSDTFLVMLNDGFDAVTGTFANDAGGIGGLFGTDGSVWTANYAAGDGNDVGLTLVAVPEPGTIGSLIGGFGVLLGLRRRKSRRA